MRPLDGGKWSLRLDLRAGPLLLAEDVIEPFVQVGFGADYVGGPRGPTPLRAGPRACLALPVTAGQRNGSGVQ